ncbi:DUF1189 domain-containing protein [Defluviitalea phaphyphila]|uniref:DUF1189 domain-containing protein n=1 Tax=Defluviitalea phaphyphila TaxID=1473580 RepID=UPI00072FFB6C|nr:DUF1189 domain-containing protein [Defluviitalea phaphyphila]
MENTKIIFLQRVKKSLSDFSFYKVIVQESIGKAVVYLILLSLILGILNYIKPFYEINKSIKKFEQIIPNITLKNGKLNVDARMPIIMGDFDDVIIVDTREGTDENILYNYKQGILVTKREIFIKYSTNTKKSYLFNIWKNEVLNKQNLINFLSFFKFIVIPFYGLIIVLLTIIVKLIGSLFVSLIGLIINVIYKANLRYKAIYKIGVYSMTLSSIIKIAINQLSIEIPFFHLLFLFVYYGVIVFYITKAIKEIKKEYEINLSQDINI